MAEMLGDPIYTRNERVPSLEEKRSIETRENPGAWFVKNILVPVELSVKSASAVKSPITDDFERTAVDLFLKYVRKNMSEPDFTLRMARALYDAIQNNDELERKSRELTFTGYVLRRETAVVLRETKNCMIKKYREMYETFFQK